MSQGPFIIRGAGIYFFVFCKLKLLCSEISVINTNNVCCRKRRHSPMSDLALHCLQRPILQDLLSAVRLSVKWMILCWKCQLLFLTLENRLGV